MIGKPMPERIYASQDTVVDAWGGVVERGWHTVQQFDEEVEYVRADLSPADNCAPLKGAIKAAMALLEVLEEDSAYGVLDAALKKYEEKC